MIILEKINSIRAKLHIIKGKGSFLASCKDCEVPISGYCLTNEIWAEAADNKEDYLCLWCVEKRLSRKLMIGDFADYPINAGILFGYRIRCDEETKC